MANNPMESGMSHQDTDVLSVSKPHHQALKQALDWLLNSTTLSGLAFRSDCTWTPKSFVFVAILWAWSDEKTLTDRFFHARKVVMAMIGLTGESARSYQAFLKMLRTWSLVITVALVDAFRRRMQTDLAKRFQVHGFSIFGVDGSRLELPRTESNEQRFSPTGTAKKPKPKSHSQASQAHAKKADSPQMWLTMMFHVGTGLAWDWRIGPSNSSEREHFQQMIPELTAGALVTADAGFVGYETWKRLLDSGRHLLIRVGANVRLLKNLGYVKQKKGLVYLWPDREAKRKQPPLVLRLVVSSGGKQPVYLVTSVLDEKRLSDQQLVEIYSLRWGAELLYRHFKQTFERCKLRSHTADHAELEANWSLLGLWSMSLHAQVELAEEGIPPRRVSVAKFLRAYRKSLREYKIHPAPEEALMTLLRKATIDPYQRANKASREYPRKKKGHAIGAPEIREATWDQIKRAREIRGLSALGLTA
jgi:Transposase DDE domain